MTKNKIEMDDIELIDVASESDGMGTPVWSIYCVKRETHYTGYLFPVDVFKYVNNHKFFAYSTDITKCDCSTPLKCHVCGIMEEDNDSNIMELFDMNPICEECYKKTNPLGD